MRDLSSCARLFSLPFFFGCFGVLPGWYLKQQGSAGHAPPLREAGEERPAPERRNTFAETFDAANLRAMVASTLVPAFGGGAYYIVFIWVAIYMESIVQVPHAFAINTAVSVAGFFFIFVMGWATDKIDRKVPQMLLFSLAFGITAPIFIGLIGNGNPLVCFFLQGTMGFMLQCFSSALIP